MLLDALLLIGILPMRTRPPAALCWCAIAASIRSFPIRLTGDAAWWTGHLMYSLR